MPMMNPRRPGGAAVLIQNSESTKSTPIAAENTNRIANRHARPWRTLNAIRLSVTTATQAHRSGSTRNRTARRGTNGTARMLATPATAVFAPIRLREIPIRSISKDSSGTVRLIPMPTIAMQAMAAAIGPDCDGSGRRARIGSDQFAQETPAELAVERDGKFRGEPVRDPVLQVLEDREGDDGQV